MRSTIFLKATYSRLQTENIAPTELSVLTTASRGGGCIAEE